MQKVIVESKSGCEFQSETKVTDGILCLTVTQCVISSHLKS